MARATRASIRTSCSTSGRSPGCRRRRRCVEDAAGRPLARRRKITKITPSPGLSVPGPATVHVDVAVAGDHFVLGLGRLLAAYGAVEHAPRGEHHAPDAVCEQHGRTLRVPAPFAPVTPFAVVF